MRIPEPWLSWAERDVRAPMWPIWRGVAVTLWGTIGLLLALVLFRLGARDLGAREVMLVIAVYSVVIALAVILAHTESVRRMAIERLRRGWRAQPWRLAVTLLVWVWLGIWFLVSRPGV